MNIKEKIESQARKEEELARLLFEEKWDCWSPPENMRSWLISENFFCIYCGTPFIEKDKLINIHLDHMDPRELGGGSELANMVACCAQCNIRKGASTFIDWLDRIPETQKGSCLDTYIRKHGHHPSETKLSKGLTISARIFDGQGQRGGNGRDA